MLRLDHVLILARDLNLTASFLRAAAGLADGPRPAFPFAGHWLYAGGRPLIHLAGAADPANAGYLGAPQTCGSAVDHIAFSGAGRDGLVARLTQQGIAFFEREVPETGERQIFVPGPDGLKLEFLFPSRRTP